MSGLTKAQKHNNMLDRIFEQARKTEPEWKHLKGNTYYKNKISVNYIPSEHKAMKVWNDKLTFSSEVWGVYYDQMHSYDDEYNDYLGRWQPYEDFSGATEGDR